MLITPQVVLPEFVHLQNPFSFTKKSMHRRILTSLLKQSSRSSSTSKGLRGQQQPTSKAVQYPKVDALTLVSEDLNAMVGEIHDELQKELKSDIELGKMAK